MNLFTNELVLWMNWKVSKFAADSKLFMDGIANTLKIMSSNRTVGIKITEGVQSKQVQTHILYT